MNAGLLMLLTFDAPASTRLPFMVLTAIARLVMNMMMAATTILRLMVRVFLLLMVVLMLASNVKMVFAGSLDDDGDDDDDDDDDHGGYGGGDNELECDGDVGSDCDDFDADINDKWWNLERQGEWREFWYHARVPST